MMPTDFEILSPPTGPPLNLDPGWPKAMRDDLTALMERHRRTPWREGDGVWLDARRYVVTRVDQRGNVEILPVKITDTPGNPT